jgi:tetrahydromethanopterin:alpha-L-glutamate ligase
VKRIAIACGDEPDWTAGALRDACRKHGAEGIFLDLLQQDADLTPSGSADADGDFDTLVIRDVVAAGNDGLSFRFDWIKGVEEKGIPVINSTEAIRNAASKYRTSCLLHRDNIPVPPTYLVQDMEKALGIIERRDVVIKPLHGYKGYGMYRIRDGKVVAGNGEDTGMPVAGMLEKLLSERGCLYMQEFVENPGRDIRAFVVGEEVIAAIYRSSADGWVNNLSQGGSSSRCVLGDKQEELCVRASEAVGTAYAGVDLIEGKNTDMVLEVNATPSGAGIYKTWGINPADRIIGHIIEKLI